MYCMTTADKRSGLLSSYRQFLKDMISDVYMEGEIRSIESLNFYNSSMFVMIRILNFVLSRVHRIVYKM
jgi:hypothetical protein